MASHSAAGESPLVSNEHQLQPLSLSAQRNLFASRGQGGGACGGARRLGVGGRPGSARALAGAGGSHWPDLGDAGLAGPAHGHSARSPGLGAMCAQSRPSQASETQTGQTQTMEQCRSGPASRHPNVVPDLCKTHCTLRDAMSCGPLPTGLWALSARPRPAGSRVTPNHGCKAPPTHPQPCPACRLAYDTYSPRRCEADTRQVLRQVARDDGDLEAAVRELSRDRESVHCRQRGPRGLGEYADERRREYSPPAPRTRAS